MELLIKFLLIESASVESFVGSSFYSNLKKMSRTELQKIRAEVLRKSQNFDNSVEFSDSLSDLLFRIDLVLVA